MRDFAAKLPRVAALALAFAEAKGDVTEPSKALIDAAMVDIPALGWDLRSVAHPTRWRMRRS